MLPPKKHIKEAIKQGVITTILLGVVPFSFSLGLDIFTAINNKSHELANFNTMLSTVLPTNHNYMNLMIFLSGIYTIPLFFLVIIENNFKIKIVVPNWFKKFILNFEIALSTVFSFMFIASSIFFTLGLLLSFSNLNISYGLSFIIIGFILFCIATFTLASIFDIRDSFLQK